MVSFVGAAMSGMESAFVDLPPGTSPRVSVLVTVPRVILAVRAKGVPGLSRCNRARWRSGSCGGFEPLNGDLRGGVGRAEPAE